MTNLNLIYVHIGNILPEGFIDNIYQTLLLNSSDINIYILLNDELITYVQNQIKQLNTVYFKNVQFNIQYIRNSLIENHLQNDTQYKNYLKTLERFDLNFRQNFWISTTKRFYYISAITELFYLDYVFHIENDVVLYDSLNNVFKYLENIEQMMFVQDAIDRVVPSIIYIPNSIEIKKLITYITDYLEKSNTFLNDMVLLAKYPDFDSFNIFPHKNHKYIFDGAAIGQYLDGVDIRNLPNLPPLNSPQYKLLQFNNPSKGFINETSRYKPNTSVFYKKLLYVNNINIPLNTLISETNDVTNIIFNAHIHSKQLYKFSSVFDLKIEDIITGDRIIGLCDFVLSTHDILNFHKNIDTFINVDKIILIKNFNKININALNTIFKQNGKKHIKLFIYTHLLEILIQTDFFHRIDTSIEYTLYVHNSDHEFNTTYEKLLNLDHIKKIYAQNINITSPKLHLLPIGLANSMWPHGNLIDFYDVMKSTYLFKKKNTIYININPSTYPYRKVILDKLKECSWPLSSGKPYKEYLKELSSYHFCLCVRGNGIDTHRFWESLYLGVIPVIINNNITNSQPFIDALNELDIPFYEIKDLNFFENKNHDEIFNKQLYTKMIIKLNNSIQNLKQLKLMNYLN